MLQVDAYVLSESSMFVSKRRCTTAQMHNHNNPTSFLFLFAANSINLCVYLLRWFQRFILKTCGTTTPLDCIEELTRWTPVPSFAISFVCLSLQIPFFNVCFVCHSCLFVIPFVCHSQITYQIYMQHCNLKLRHLV